MILVGTLTALAGLLALVLGLASGTLIERVLLWSFLLVGLVLAITGFLRAKPHTVQVYKRGLLLRGERFTWREMSDFEVREFFTPFSSQMQYRISFRGKNQPKEFALVSSDNAKRLLSRLAAKHEVRLRNWKG